jgi:uncharacterized protein DUF3592
MKKMVTVAVVLGVAVLLVVVAIVVGSRWRGGGADSYLRTQETLKSGVPASARVLELRDTGGRLNSNPVVEFKLEVHPDSGAPFVTATSAVISTVDLPRFQPGATIAVKYDPSDRSSVAIITP